MFWFRKKKKRKKAEEDDSDEERRRWHNDLRAETKQSVWAVVFLSCALLFSLAWMGKAGLAGNGISAFFTLLFGKTFLVVPSVFFLAGLSLLFSMRSRFMGAAVWGAFLLLISVLGLGGIWGGREFAGYVGYGIAYAPVRFFDVTASSSMLGALLLISFLLMFNMALMPRRMEEDKDETEKNKDMDDKSLNTEEKRNVFSRIVQFFRGSTVLQTGKSETTPDEINPADEPEEESDNTEETVSEAVLHSSKSLPPPALLKPVVSRRIPSDYKPPPLSLLENDRGKPSSGDIRANANIIQRTLQNFGIDVDMGEVSVGPSITQYTLKPAEGVKLQRITNLASNLGLALAAHPLRIEAPIPGRSLVGIEVPNKSIAFVGLRNLLTEFLGQKREYLLGFALGRDVTGQAVFADLAQMPHLLVAGSTGSGKSVAIHSLLMGLVFSNPPELLRIIMIDPKRVELAYYNGIPHLMSPVVTEAKKAIQALRWAVSEMDRRYQQLQAAGARDIISYNNNTANEDVMPFLVVVIDELADLIATFPREVEASVVRLAQMARAVGIHLVVSTQRPSVEVITGLIKANITTRIALQVASQIDSRTILDMGGAEKLLGKGDMLYLPGDATKPRRLQGVYVSEDEVKRVTQYLQQLKEAGDYVGEEDMIFDSTRASNAPVDEDEARDELYEAARALVITAGKASTSLLQRRLRLGYARAARLIDVLEERGVVGPADGAKPRDVLVSRAVENTLERDLHEA